MRIAVCDDNQQFLGQIVQQLNSIPAVREVHSFSDLPSFLKEAMPFDAVFMDINWNQSPTGIDMAETLLTKMPQTKIVYVTGYGEDYAQHIFLHPSNLSGFLTKPVDQKLLEANVQKIADQLHTQERSICVKAGSNTTIVPYDNIRYLESKGHNIVIHTTTDDLVIYERLQTFLKKLPPYFIQCHKSFVVNLRKIRRFQSTDILLKTGDVVPISRSRYAQTRTAYFTFMGMEL